MINKILAIFLLFISISFFFIWEFVQSEFVANVLSDSITKYTKENLDLELKFENIQFNLFPPGAEFKNVKAKSLNSEVELEAELSSLGLEFDVWDIFETDLTISNVFLKDGKVLFDKKEISKGLTNQESKPSDIEIEKIIQIIEDKSPVVLKRVTLHKIRLELFKKNEVVTHYAMLELINNSIHLNLILRGFNLGKIKMLEEVVDELSIDVNLSDEKIKINNLVVEKNLNRVVTQGEVSNYKNIVDMNLKLDSYLDVQLADLHKYLKFKNIGEIYNGNLKTNIQVNGTISNYEVNSELSIHNLDSDFVSAKKIKSEILLNPKKLVLTSFKLENNAEKITLLDSIEFYDFEKRKFLEDKVTVDIEKLKLGNGLRFLKSFMKPLKGSLTGKVDFVLNEKDFNLSLSKDSYVENLKLQFAEDKPIVSINKLKIGNGFFNVAGSDVDIDLSIEIDKTKGDIKGKVREGEISFYSKGLELSLGELGPYAGLNIEGVGVVDLTVLSNSIESKLRIKNQLEDINFENFKIDKLSSEFELNFRNSKIKLSDIEAKTGQSTISGDFGVSLNDMSIEASLTQKNFLIKDLTQMYSPVIGDLSFLPKNLYGNWSTSLTISGGLSADKININGKFFGKNNLIYDESFDEIIFDYSFISKKLLFENFSASKNTGKVFGGFSYGIDNENIDIWGNISNIPLTEINNYTKLPLSLLGNLNGLIKASISPTEKLVTSELYVSKSSVNNRKVYDSHLKVDLKNNDIKIKASILGEQIKLDSVISLKDSDSNDSFVKTSVNVKSLNEVFSIFSFVDNINNGFEGEIIFKNKTEFNLKQLFKFNTRLSFEKLVLKKDKINVNYNSKVGSSQIVVENGNIKNWDVDIRGSKFTLLSKGSGEISKDYNISSKIKFDASLLEIFNVLISKANGTIVGNIENFKNSRTEDYNAKIISSDLELNSDFMPLALTKGNMLLTYKDKEVLLKRLNAQLNSGQLSMNGLINFEKVIPEINIRYMFKNAGITLFKKSNILFSGNGSLIGKTIPYTLGGDLQIQQLNIVNEITDFAGGDSIVTQKVDYLPENTTKGLDQFLNLNVNITTIDPVRVTNSMVNVGFSGNLQITGGERDPRLTGKFSLAPMKNEVYFKNNVFSLTKGNILFFENNLISNPELDFQAESEINEYKVFLKLLGSVEDYKLDLSAEPSLSKSDVLSLIAFGFTEDLSSNLTDAEKDSMTKAGVGSIIFDRFKINETLKNEFGLQINLGTEITQDESSYLSQRNSDTSLGRVTSATKIEVKKQISDAIDLSVSSTVGSTTGQRQSMNLNYNIDKNFSIEGVYENTTDGVNETISDDTSLGADVKVRWSFK